MDTIELTYHEGKDGMLYPNITAEPDTGRTSSRRRRGDHACIAVRMRRMCESHADSVDN